MKILAPILLLISLTMACFTDPQGQGVWVSRSEVVSVLHAVACDKRASTQIITVSGVLCVKETPQEVLKKLDETK